MNSLRSLALILLSMFGMDSHATNDSLVDELVNACKIKSLDLDADVGMDQTDLRISLTIDRKASQPRSRCLIYWNNELAPQMIDLMPSTSNHCGQIPLQSEASPQLWHLSSILSPDSHSLNLTLRRKISHTMRDFSALASIPMPRSEIDDTKIRFRFSGPVLAKQEPMIGGLTLFPVVRRSHKDGVFFVDAEMKNSNVFENPLEMRFPLTENHRSIVFSHEEQPKMLIFPALPKYQRPLNKLSLVLWGTSLSDAHLRSSRVKFMESYFRERQPKTISIINIGNDSSLPQTVSDESEGIDTINSFASNGLNDPERLSRRILAELPKDKTTNFDLVITSDDLDAMSAEFLLASLKEFQNAQIFVLVNETQWTRENRLKWVEVLSASVLDLDSPASHRPFQFYPWSIQRSVDLPITHDWLFPNDGFMYDGGRHEGLVGKVVFRQRNQAERFSLARMSPTLRLHANSPTLDSSTTHTEITSRCPSLGTPNETTGASIESLETLLLRHLKSMSMRKTDPKIILDWLYRLSELSEKYEWKKFLHKIQMMNNQQLLSESGFTTRPSEWMNASFEVSGTSYPAQALVIEVCSELISTTSRNTPPQPAQCVEGTAREIGDIVAVTIQSEVNAGAKHYLNIRRNSQQQAWAATRIVLDFMQNGIERRRDMGLHFFAPEDSGLSLPINFLPNGSSTKLDSKEEALSSARMHYETRQYQQVLSILSSPREKLGIEASVERALLQGLAHLRLGNFAAAQSLFQKANELAPERSDVIYNWACALALGAQVEKAIDVFESLGKNASVNANMRNQLIQHALGDPDLLSITTHPRWKRFVSSVTPESPFLQIPNSR